MPPLSTLAFPVILLLLAAACTGQQLPTTSANTLFPTATVNPTPAQATSVTGEATTNASATVVPTSPSAVFATATSLPTSPVPPASSTPTLELGSTAAVTAASRVEPADLKYLLIAQFGEPFFCDPDEYPVARELSDSDVEQRFAQIQASAPLYQVILLHLGLVGQGTLTIDQKRTVYAEYKKLNSIILQPAGDKLEFRMRIPATARTGYSIQGLIDTAGNISDTSRQPSVNTCPICLAANTLIATPNGEIPVQELGKGMAIWTVNSHGARVGAVVSATIRREVPGLSTLVELALQDGRGLIVSPGHPLTDGRIVADLAPGDTVDGADVARLDRVPYQDGATYDILPSGDTGFYWANGILFKSTLAR